jgi:hypothetical protein
MYNKSVRYVNVAQFDLIKHEISRSIRRGQIFFRAKMLSKYIFEQRHLEHVVSEQPCL